MFNSDETNFLAQMRAKYAAGDTPSTEDMLRSILLLRGSRKRALEAQAASKSKSPRSKAPQRNTDDLLGELEGL